MPLMVPSVASSTISGGFLVLNLSNTSVWLNCPNVIDVEIVCSISTFGGLAADTWTTPPQSFSSSPYTYNTFSINISTFCPGTVYKYRIRERNNGSSVFFSLWSSTLTFTTPGVYIAPTLTITASPNLICPPAPVQLNAQVAGGCGSSPITYAWFPSTGLSNAFIANPVANVTSPISYTCIVSGGTSGCWNSVGTIFLNIGAGPPVP